MGPDLAKVTTNPNLAPNTHAANVNINNYIISQSSISSGTYEAIPLPNDQSCLSLFEMKI